MAGVLPNRALIEAPAEHREGWIAMIRSRHYGRPERAKCGRSLKIAQIELEQLFSANLYRSGRLDAPPFQPLLPGEIEWVKIRIDKAVTPCSL
jgi:hypothetical protein